MGEGQRVDFPAVPRRRPLTAADTFAMLLGCLGLMLLGGLGLVLMALALES